MATKSEGRKPYDPLPLGSRRGEGGASGDVMTYLRYGNGRSDGASRVTNSGGSSGSASKDETTPGSGETGLATPSYSKGGIIKRQKHKYSKY